MFQNESGGHRWQRIPHSEKKGRVHTSTVTVAVLPDDGLHSFTIDPDDLQWRTTKGSGPGGQNRNKRENCVVLTHRPSGITVRVDSKSQSQNKDQALIVLQERLQAKSLKDKKGQRNSDRRSQLGSGMRGDKVRTIRVRDGIVTDHVSGRKIALKKYLRGELP
ncbi:PCRF domain-containing protein [Candidatus Bathyarchaeota archaeon]|nr:PCRF domain-containing protein [Candidatus Bathyarchaeota archaeon]